LYIKEEKKKMEEMTRRAQSKGKKTA